MWRHLKFKVNRTDKKHYRTRAEQSALALCKLLFVVCGFHFRVTAQTRIAFRTQLLGSRMYKYNCIPVLKRLVFGIPHTKKIVA
jgi:hypothetical protein